MKKSILLFLSILISFISFSQIDVNTLSENDKKIVKVFRETYVEKKFKDPYSFQLLKLETKPITFGDWDLNDIIYLKSQLEKKDFKYVKENELIDRIKLKEDSYSKMSDEIKKTIKSYEVKLDCYGSNSYGGKVLSRYKFNYVVLDLNMNPIDYYNGNNLYVTEIK
jgi:hypothetical protein